MSETLPLFPLNTVLLPGAALGLRVFEPRYLDLVRECGRRGSGFGVCLIAEGTEAGAPATPQDCGTEARIEDFDTGPDGLLHLRLRGHRRFRVTASQVREGFSKVKGKAKACGTQHGVEPGAIVRVKVSIGGSGDVISVDAQDSYAGTPLGDCVANALKDAHFPRFNSESQGTVYPVSF